MFALTHPRGPFSLLPSQSNPDNPNRNGQWRAHYLFTPSNSSLTGEINIDVHYYEDGNVRLQTSKPITISNTSDAIKEIAKAEKSYQTEVNQAFTRLNEGAFKGLRRQLPVTRQKVEWEKISGYRVSFILLTIQFLGGFC
jgi:capping protein alpha